MPVELTVAYWTISGTFPGIEPEYSRFGFQQRVEAASKAGFTGMGFWHADLEHVLEHNSLPEMKRVLDNNGIQNIEVEFLTDWFLDGERKKQSDARKKMLMEAAEVLEAKQIKVGDFFQEQCSMPRLIDAFAALCAEAGEHGTRIAFEPMAVSMVHTLEDSLAMFRGAGAKNGGIVLDLWHMINLGIPLEQVAAFPAEYLFGAEVNDGVFETSSDGQRKPNVHRKFCGDGEFDIQGFIDAVSKTGYNGPWGIEIFSQDLLDRPLEELTARAYKTTRDRLGRL